MSEIDRTRAGFKKRLDALNKKRVSSAKELDTVFTELVKVSREQAVWEVVAAVLKVFPRCVQKTPVDTGRVRAAWLVSTKSTEYVPKEGGDFGKYTSQASAAATAEIQRNVPNLMLADVIYIINNVEYIMSLEAGWSKQGAGFIALMLEELKATLTGLIQVQP